MMDEFRYIGEFLSAIVGYWFVLVGGAAIMTLLGIIERWRGKEVHFRLYLAILVLLFFVAIYLSWKDARLQANSVASPAVKLDVNVADYQGRANLEQTAKDLTNKLAIAEAKLQQSDEGRKQTDAELTQTKGHLAEATDRITKLTSDFAEAKRRAEELEEKQRPRTITPEQRDKFKALIQESPAPQLLGAEVPKPEIAIGHFGDDEGYNFALEIRALLLECGFPTSEVSYESHGLRIDSKDEKLGTVSSRPPGIFISVADLKYQSPWSGRIRRALTILNNGEVKALPMTDASVVQRFAQAEVIIIVGKKP